MQDQAKRFKEDPPQGGKEVDMINRISGRVRQVSEEAVYLEVGPLEYEVHLPDFVRRQLQSKVDQHVTLLTMDYLEGNPMQGRMVPRLIGFLTEVEREFFEVFCSVDGLGVKKALRALVRPVPEIADAIEKQSTAILSTLPGIGAAIAERIVAKLRRKMAKFALMVASEASLATADPQARPIAEECLEVLQAVGHSAVEARKMVETILLKKKKYKDVQDMITAIYQETHGG